MKFEIQSIKTRVVESEQVGPTLESIAANDEKVLRIIEKKEENI